jgi:hypothetical protein
VGCGLVGDVMSGKSKITVTKISGN